jgi:hypothetical protein
MLYQAQFFLQLINILSVQINNQSGFHSFYQTGFCISNLDQNSYVYLWSGNIKTLWVSFSEKSKMVNYKPDLAP